MPNTVQDWRPGRSVSHVDGSAGTLGAFVQLNPAGVAKHAATPGFNPALPYQAFLSAAHVLAPPLPKLNTGDRILSPGYPDGPRNGANLHATLIDYSNLSDNIPNTMDIALAVLRHGNYATANYVPNPAHPNQLAVLAGFVATADLAAMAAAKAPVFKIGRTTDFRRGILLPPLAGVIALNIGGFPYNYSGLWAVEFVPPDDFSGPGDSGSLVYDDQFRALGFLVGARGNASFFYPAQDCFNQMDVVLA